jgi:hypothetical protein
MLMEARLEPRYDTTTGLTGTADESAAIFWNALLIVSCVFRDAICIRRVVFAANWHS